MKAVLVLVDLQEDYLCGPSRIQPPREVLVRRAALLLEGFRRRNMPVIHVWTTLGPDDGPRFAHWRKNGLSKCVRGTPGHHPPTLLRPAPGEPIVHKRGFNAFTGSRLDLCLDRADQHTVILAGVHLHACVRTAAVECLERDYTVIIARDAVGTNAPIHSAATERWLSERCAAFHSVADCLSLLDGRAPEGSVYQPHGTPTGCSSNSVPGTPTGRRP